MKKTILLAIAATLALTTIAQKSDTTILEGSRLIYTDVTNNEKKIIMEVTKGGDTLTIEKVKVIKIGNKVFSFAELSNPGTVTLNVPMQWIIANFQYLDNSSGGLSKKQVEDLQAPLKGYYDYYQYLVQQQRQSQQKQ